MGIVWHLGFVVWNFYPPDIEQIRSVGFVTGVGAGDEVVTGAGIANTRTSIAFLLSSVSVSPLTTLT